MFDASTYRERREALRALGPSGLILFLGHRPASRNYKDNPYPFRQSSHVLYYCGISRPNIALLIGPNDDVLFGPEEDIDDIIWHGPHESLREAADKAGIREVRAVPSLSSRLAEHQHDGGTVHYLPPFQADSRAWLAEILGVTAVAIDAAASPELMRAVVAQREVKTDAEIEEIEVALEVTAAMHREAMRVGKPGKLEADVAAAIQHVGLAKQRAQSYNPIVTVRGEVLHNNEYHRRLEAGQLLLNDSGAESPRFYASDITRTFPVSGSFTPVQRDLYELVLRMQLGGIGAVRPGVRYRDVHLATCRILVDGLTELGLMQGNPEDAVEAGAHALFFPHGLGHMLGLDVHDMEDLGDVVGYSEGESRSPQFGLNFLRLSKPLQPGFVFTVEPGIYFIPALIDRWRDEKRHEHFIRFERVSELREFGGIRIEDDVLCTESGARVLGPGIPKTVDEIEATMAS